MPTDTEMVKSIFGDTGNPAPDDNNEPEPKAPENDPDTPEDGGEGEGKKQPETPAEKLLAGKYKTVEELEAAYKELERGFHGDRQERAELRRQLEELKAAMAPKKPEVDPKEYRQQLVERLYSEPDAVIAELADQIADKKLQQALGPVMPVIQQQILNSQVQNFMATVPDAQEYAGDMAFLVQSDPNLAGQPNWLEKAYLMAKVARLEAKLSGKDAGEKAAKAADVKKAAAMPKGGKAEPPVPETEEEKLVKNIFGTQEGKRKMFDF